MLRLLVLLSCLACFAATSAKASEEGLGLTAFFARELLGDKSVGDAFEGAGAVADVKAGLIQISSK
jgi:hypothetical protein